MVKELCGIGSSSGKASGVVNIISSERDYKKVNGNSIIVCKTTVPDMVPIMKKSRAVVCDEGGILDHPSIICREFGIPCVVATKVATKLLKENKEIKVDGTKGVIFY